jgi:DNA-binding NarL/FixJ family response regulator
VIPSIDPVRALEMLESGIDAQIVICALELAGTLIPDGNQVARLCKEIRPEIPVMLTSQTVTSYERANNADAFIPKGMTTFELRERIRTMCARKRGPRKSPASEALPVVNFDSQRQSA